jgi:hypothetical protein
MRCCGRCSLLVFLTSIRRYRCRVEPFSIKRGFSELFLALAPLRRYRCRVEPFSIKRGFSELFLALAPLRRYRCRVEPFCVRPRKRSCPFLAFPSCCHVTHDAHYPLPSLLAYVFLQPSCGLPSCPKGDWWYDRVSRAWLYSYSSPLLLPSQNPPPNTVRDFPARACLSQI